MRDTRFIPTHRLPRCARASRRRRYDTSRGGLLHGIVHDENAWALGGVAGHAGLFSIGARPRGVRADAARWRRRIGGVRILTPQTLARWTARQCAHSSRALGWDTPGARLERGPLLLAAQLRPHGLHRHVDLDRSRARPVRGAADESRQLARRARATCSFGVTSPTRCSGRYWMRRSSTGKSGSRRRRRNHRAAGAGLPAFLNWELRESESRAKAWGSVAVILIRAC